jgi:hypothetical protein
MTRYTEDFSHFVTSMTAPIASGWSDSCRVGLAPIEERRLVTAHTHCRHSTNGNGGSNTQSCRFYRDFGVGDRQLASAWRASRSLTLYRLCWTFTRYSGNLSAAETFVRDYDVLHAWPEELWGAVIFRGCLH